MKDSEPAILIPIEALNEKCPEDRKTFKIQQQNKNTGILIKAGFNSLIQGSYRILIGKFKELSRTLQGTNSTFQRRNPI